MKGVIDFLKYVRNACNNNLINNGTCKKCPFYINKYCNIIFIDRLTDKEIADLVRAVEKRWRERVNEKIN